MEPFTLLTAATGLGGVFIKLAPEIIKATPQIIKAVADYKQGQQQSSSEELERQQLQRSLENLRSEFQTEQFKNQKEIQTYQNLVKQLEIRDAAQIRVQSEPERIRWETFWQQLNQQRQLEQKLAAYSRQTQLDIAKSQRESTLQLPEVNKLFDNWPLTIVPSQILSTKRAKNRLPLRIFLSPPTVQFERFNHHKYNLPELEPKLTQRLRKFLDQNYSLQDDIRPTEFLGGAWDSKRARGEASITALFSMLKSEPSLVLETEIIDKYELSFRIGYWGLGEESYCYESIAILQYFEIMCSSARNRALEWKKRKQQHLSDNRLTKDQINKLGGDNELNLQVLEEEEKLKSLGEDPYEQEVYLKYRLNDKDFKKFYDILIVCHCLVAGWISDAYHYIQNDVPPLLPKLIHEITSEVDAPQSLRPIIQGVVAGYRMLFISLSEERRSLLPEMSLQLAQSLSELPDKSPSREHAYHSIKSWLKQRNISSPPEGVESIQMMQSVITMADKPYIENLKTCFSVVGDAEVKSSLFDLDWKLKRLQNDLDDQYQQGVENGQKGNYTKSIAKFSYVIQLDPNYVNAYFSRGYVYVQIGQLEQAIANYSKAIQLNPEYLEAYINRGNTHYKMNDFELAVKDYDQALFLKPNITEVIKYREQAMQVLNSQQH